MIIMPTNNHPILLGDFTTITGQKLSQTNQQTHDPMDYRARNENHSNRDSRTQPCVDAPV